MPSLDDLITEKVEEAKQEEAKQEEVKHEEILQNEIVPPIVEEPKPEPEPVVEEEKTTEEPNDAGINKFDFAALKKSLAEPTEVVVAPPKKEDEPKQPETPRVDTKSNEEDENKQYIELALSTYNDNKHHNTDYPNQVNNIKISEDDDEGGIYQPENRSVLSSVIEDILNNKKGED